MSLELWAVNDDGDLVEWTDRLPADTLDVVIHAAEVSVGSSQVTIKDTDAQFGIRGHRLLYFKETAAAGDNWNGIIGPFYTWNRQVRRDFERTGAARTWTVNLSDINTLLSRRVQKGSDAKRPQETDIVRLNWLIDTAEVVGGVGGSGLAIEDTSLIFTDNPVTMSKSDYRGVDSAQVINDLLQQAGGNAFLYNSPDDDDDIRVGIWYGRDEREDFASPHRITNDLAEISPETLDGAWMFNPTIDYETDEFTFAPSIDAELDRDPSRVYSGAYLNRDGGSSYQQRLETAENFAARDGVFQAELVKTQAQADARARRYTRDNSQEDDAITCAVLVPAELVHAWYPGHRVSVKFTHLPGYEDWTWMRAAAVGVRQLAKESNIYELALDLRAEAPLEAGQPGGPSVPGGVFATLNRPGTVGETGAGSELMWGSNGDNPKPGWPTEPTQGLLSIITDPTPPLDPWPYEGIQVDGDGTLDRIEFMAFTAGILLDDIEYTVTWAILQNGATIASATQVVSGFLEFWGSQQEVVALNISVADGDRISASVTSSPPMPYFRVPSGTGGQDERLRIIGGTLT